MDDEDRLQLTLAGEALLSGENPLPLLRKQVINFQFPAAWCYKGPSAVHPRFKVHPFVFILRLLADRRLGNYLTEKEDVAKIVICYAENNSDECLDSVVDRIIRLRQYGDSSLEHNYVEKFRSSRSKHSSLSKLFDNHSDIANTMRNWLAYCQLISVESGVWRLNPSATDIIAGILHNPPDFIPYPGNEEQFQRRYGLDLKRTKDLRDLTKSRTITAQMIDETNLRLAFLEIAARQIVTTVSPDLIRRVAEEAGVDYAKSERFLRREYPTGGVGLFMSEYAEMAMQSRERATDFEIATASIFSDVFGFKTKHIGAKGLVPDIYIESSSENFCGIIDNKAYRDGYSISNDHYNKMVYDYIPNVHNYCGSEHAHPLQFFTYIAAEYKPTVSRRIRAIGKATGVQGSILTATDVIRMVEMHKEHPFTHSALRDLFSIGRAITIDDIVRANQIA